MARPFQFRLRTMFWLTAVVAVLCWAGPPVVQQARKRLFPPNAMEIPQFR